MISTNLDLEGAAKKLSKADLVHLVAYTVGAPIILREVRKTNKWQGDNDIWCGECLHIKHAFGIKDKEVKS